MIASDYSTIGKISKSDNQKKFHFSLSNSYDPLKSMNYSPSMDVLGNRVKATYCSLRSGEVIIVRHYTSKEVNVYGALTRFLGKNRDNLVYPKIETIAKIACCGKSTAARAIRKFENDLLIYKRDTGRESHYYFVPLNDDGTPDQNSGEYQFAKALLEDKKAKKKARRELKMNPETVHFEPTENSNRTRREFKMNSQRVQNEFSQMSQNQPKNEPEKSPQTIVKPTIRTDQEVSQKNTDFKPILDNIINKRTNNNNRPDGNLNFSEQLKNVVVVSLKNLICDRYRNGISNELILESIKKHGQGKTKDIINRVNNTEIKKSAGGYFRQLLNANDLMDLDDIPAHTINPVKSYSCNDSISEIIEREVEFQGNRYVIDDAGALVTDKGVYNQFQVKRMIENGTIVYVNQTTS